jgi:hypothetical protein
MAAGAGTLVSGFTIAINSSQGCGFHTARGSTYQVGFFLCARCQSQAQRFRDGFVGIGVYSTRSSPFQV